MMSTCPESPLQVNADSKGKSLLLVAAICAIAFLSTWATGLIVSPASNWLFRYHFLGAAFVLGLGGTYLWVRRVGRQQMEAQRFFQALAQIDPLKLAQGTWASDLPSVAPTNPWSAPVLQLTGAFHSLCEHVDHVEHKRIALEVRSKRNAARHGQIETILAALPEAVIVVDAGDQLILANPAAEQLLGIDLSASGNRAITHVLPCEKLLELIGEMRRRKAPRQRSLEIELAGEDGKPRCYGATASRLTVSEQSSDEVASTGGVFVVLRDITVLKASHKRNAEFVSAVSHEMKTPLAGIKAYVELLADGDAEDTQTREEFLNVINGQANRLQRLIDNLLNLARIEAGVVQVSKGAMSLNEVLQEAFNLVRPAAEAKQIRLNIDLSEMYVGVWADRDMIMQAAINLLSNAIKYTPEGGCVTLRSRLADQEVIFEVEDTGVGLCAEDQLCVFEKFYRVKKDRDMASGTGLGLPLAKHIVEDVHGGRLTVESQLGQGSTFTVAIPAAAQMTCHI